MSSEAHVILQQYRDAIQAAEGLKEQVLDIYLKLPSIKEKLLFVLENGFDFLQEESWYCPHVRLKSGREVSLYDDLYWERRETNTLDNLFEHISDNLEEIEIDWDEVEDANQAMLMHVDEILELDTPSVVIVKDMLSKGIGRATFDW